METDLSSQQTHGEFSLGDPVVYGLHGKCRVAQIETRVMGGKTIRFYKLEVLKSALSRSSRSDPAIWVPITNSTDLGLRAPMNQPQAEVALKYLTDRDTFPDLDMDESWHSLQTKLETIAKHEGGLGLAKVFCFMSVLKRRLVAPASPIIKFYDLIHKLLFRELSETLNEAPKVIEDRITKNLLNKRIPHIK